MPKVLIIESRRHDPWRNLALEAFLLDIFPAKQAEEGLDAILYLWQNENTVVIGRNQNAWAECKTALLEAEGGKLARRSTGGGAVFHDLGNLNFSLIVPRRTFSLDDNFGLIVRAVAKLGIRAERSGRNDVLTDGRKFSGNAFSLRQDVGLHHGTLLVNSDYARVARYLTVSPAKLQAKGVSSVRSRIINLSEINPELSISAVVAAMEAAFVEQFGGTNSEVLRLSDAEFDEQEGLRQLCGHYGSWEWRYGETITFDASVETRMDWGFFGLGIQVGGGHVANLKVQSDALDCDFLERVSTRLQGCRFHSSDLASAVLETSCQGESLGQSREQMRRDIADLVLAQGW